MARGRSVCIGGLTMLFLVAPASAGATATLDAKKACSQAYTEAQEFRDAHKLIEAREQLRLCAQPTCKDFIVKDCGAWLTDVEARLPSVVFSPKDGQGQDLIDVTVSSEGKVLTTRIEGTTVDIDPGPHTFTFQTPEGAQAQQTVVVLEGQKGRLVTAVLAAPLAPAPPVLASPPAVGAPSAPASSPPSAAPPAAGTPERGGATATASVAPRFWTTPREVGLAAGGVGLAAVIVGSVFGSLSESAAHQQIVDCASATACANHSQALTDHQNASTDGAVATAGVVGGAVLLAGGAALLLLGGDDSGASSKKDPTELSLTPLVGFNHFGLLLTREF